MSSVTLPVCRAEPEAASEPLFSRAFSAKNDLVCRPNEAFPPLAQPSWLERWSAWEGRRSLDVATSFAARILQDNPISQSSPEPDPWGPSLVGLFSDFLGGLAGCAGSSAARPASTMPQGAVLMSGEFRGRYDLLGDPDKYGTILFYRQSYGSMPDMDNNLASLDAYEDTLQYQWHILKSLELEKPKHVFVEDLPIDFPAGDRAPLMKYIKDGLGDFKHFFSKYDLPSEREPKYFQLLAAYKQVALIYAYKHPEVHLHRVIEPAESDEMHVQLEQVWVRHQGNPAEVRKDPEFQRLMFTLPEAYAVREIMKFYKEHPGEKIALIFGKMNNFCDNFQAIHYLPRIASFWWSEPTDPLTIPKACE
ncbi:MAG: hypothetical protein U1F66_11335 [bacterium]